MGISARQEFINLLMDAMMIGDSDTIKNVAGEMFKEFGLDEFKFEKEVRPIDNGFIESCIEQGELGLARQYLEQFYNMDLAQCIIHIGKVMQKKVVIE